MTQDLHYQAEAATLGEEQRGARVPQTVERDGRHLNFRLLAAVVARALHYLATEIVPEDIALLVSNATMEGLRLEYKANLSLFRDQDKKEFLADVTSFANAAGGGSQQLGRANLSTIDSSCGTPDSDYW